MTEPAPRHNKIALAGPFIASSLIFWLFPQWRFLTGILSLLVAEGLNSKIERILEKRVKKEAAPEYDRIMSEQRTFGAVLIVCGALVIFAGAVLAEARNWDKLSVVVLSMGLGIAVAYNLWLAGRCILFLYQLGWKRVDFWLSVSFLISVAYCTVLVIAFMISIMNKGF